VEGWSGEGTRSLSGATWLSIDNLSMKFLVFVVFDRKSPKKPTKKPWTPLMKMWQFQTQCPFSSFPLSLVQLLGDKKLVDFKTKSPISTLKNPQAYKVAHHPNPSIYTHFISLSVFYHNLTSYHFAVDCIYFQAKKKLRRKMKCLCILLNKILVRRKENYIKIIHF
jgi:hypothetical protein